MTQSKPICPACDEPSESKGRCSNCGKLLDTEDSSDYGRSVLGGSQ